MDIKSKAKREEINGYAYSSIAAKLYGFSKDDKKTRLISSFSYQDASREAAIILLLKQFGFVPQDINSADGKIQTTELDGLDKHDGLTIIIESIFLSDANSTRADSKGDQIKDKQNNVKRVDFTQSYIRENSNIPTTKQIDMIDQQTKEVSKRIAKKDQPCISEYIYLSGFSFSSSNQEQNEYMEGGYLPWYMELGDASGVKKIYTQPDLEFFLKNLPEQPPTIANLEEYLDSVTSHCSKE